MWYHVHHQTGINFKKCDNSKGWKGYAEMGIQYGSTEIGTQTEEKVEWKNHFGEQYVIHLKMYMPYDPAILL